MQRGALPTMWEDRRAGLILHKPGLTPEEWNDTKRHPHIGYEMLDISFLSGAAVIVHAHHERFDGKIPRPGMRSARRPRFSIADAFDAMTQTAVLKGFNGRDGARRLFGTAGPSDPRSKRSCCVRPANG
jgi:response regulator RpfG family c-di-GMP phosphodiesterase